MYIYTLRSVHPVFAQVTFLLSSQILWFTMLLNWPDTPKVSLTVGASTFPCNFE